MNIVLKIVLTLVMMLVWAVGKGVAQKVQGSDYGLLTWIVSIICLWIISDMWFFNALFFKNNEKSNSSVQNNTENESYLKTINNMSHSMPEKQVNIPVQLEKQDTVKHSEMIMNNNEYSEAINEDELYLQATNEVDEKNQEKALWAKCMALCEGDESKAKYRYIKERVDRLRDERVKEIEEQKELMIKLHKEKQEKLIEPYLSKKNDRLDSLLHNNDYGFHKSKYGPYILSQKGADKSVIFKTEQEFDQFLTELLPKLKGFGDNQ